MRVSNLSYSNLKVLKIRYGSFLCADHSKFNILSFGAACELYGTEYQGNDIVRGGRFSNFTHDYIEDGYTVIKCCSGMRHDAYVQFMEQLLSWIAYNCQGDDWTMRFEPPVISDNLLPEIHIIFRNPTAAILYKLVWS